MQQTGLERRIKHGAIQALFVILILHIVSPFAASQSPATPKASNEPPQKPASEMVFYVESWKKGPGQVREKTVHVEFHKQNEIYKGVVEDEAGTPKYELVIAPIHQTVESGTRLVGWGIDLNQGKDRGVNTLLQVGRWQGDSFSREDSIAWLQQEDNPALFFGPADYPGYPLSSKRVIKVESFYCIIQVKGYRLQSKQKQVALEKQKGFAWISIDIVFSNRYDGPRDQH